MEFQKQSLGIQAAAATESHNYQLNLEKERASQDLISTAFAKLSSSAPGIISMVNSLVGLSNKKFTINFNSNTRQFSITLLP